MACMQNGFIQGLQLDGRFTALSPLNHGSFGMVFLAKDNQTGDQVAIKCLTKQTSSDGLGNDHLLELLCHDRLGHHKNIVNLVHAFETDAHMFLVLEFCSMGDLYEAIRLGKGPLETEHVRELMLQLIDAVEFMHSKGLYHRDVKPENIFLAADGSLKLGDFGLSTTETWTHEACVGSDRYMAPEQYDPAEIGYSPAQADIWSIGICLLNILFSRNPFVTPTQSDILYSDFVRDRESLFDIFPSMSQETFNILIHALAVDPTKRSLSELRKAVKNATTFTSDDEIFDDFCTEDRPLQATGQRQPLRTPSIQSPPVEQSGAFPWAKVLHMSPTSRQLSVIHDTEIEDDLFPEKPTYPWYSSKNNDTNSLASVIDSALGASIKSMNLREPTPRNPPKVSESVPVPKALASVFGNYKEQISKSWSDLWDEEEEEELDARRRYNARNWSSETIDEDITVRPGLTTLPSVADSAEHSPIEAEFSVFGSSDDIHAVPQLSPITPKTPVYSPPAKRSVMDKWTALGNRRRAVNNEPKENKSTESTWRRGFGLQAFSGNKSKPTVSSFGQGVDVNARNGLGFAGWKHMGNSNTNKSVTNIAIGKEIPGQEVKIMDWRRDTHSSQRYDIARQDHHHQHQRGDDLGDSEWVGWADLQL